MAIPINSCWSRFYFTNKKSDGMSICFSLGRTVCYGFIILPRVDNYVLLFPSSFLCLLIGGFKQMVSYGFLYLIVFFWAGVLPQMSSSYYLWAFVCGGKE